MTNRPRVSVLAFLLCLPLAVMICPGCGGDEERSGDDLQIDDAAGPENPTGESPQSPGDPILLLWPSSGSGQPVGTKITWIAFAVDGDLLSWRYRFLVGHEGGPLRIVRDFNGRNTFRWTPLEEGRFQVRAEMRSEVTGEVHQVTRTYCIASRVPGGDAAVTPTDHPLVALYSAAPIEADRVRVQFREVGTETFRYTAWKTCRPGKSTNLYVAGMRADTLYEMGHQSEMGSWRSDSRDLLLFRTGVPEIAFPDIRVVEEPSPWSSQAEDVVLWSTLVGKELLVVFPFATDLRGNVVWYYDVVGNVLDAGYMLTRPVQDGTFLITVPGDSGQPNRRGQVLREFDLAGCTLRETNVARVNEQLLARGEDRINMFHHDALRLENGHTLVLGSVERFLTYYVQGPEPVDFLGDMVIDLDPDWQVSWVWNSFEHLDPTRTATMGDFTEKGVYNIGGPLRLADRAHDWTHTNTITYSPSDGNLILSMRSQDWVLKIDYRDGLGTGEILWRLGREGDFQLFSDEAFPWFSHQHQPMVYGDDEIVLLDNGNLRCRAEADCCTSRGQVYALDEDRLEVTLERSFDLGSYSAIAGSAQKLSNGNYHFLTGEIEPLFPEATIEWLSHLGAYCRSVEVGPDGEILSALEIDSVTYRTFRMKGLYDF